MTKSWVEALAQSNGGPAYLAQEDIMRHASRFAVSSEIERTGFLQIEIPSTLRHRYPVGATHIGFIEPEFQRLDYGFVGGKALVIWLKKGFWNPSDGPFEACYPELKKQTAEFTKVLANRYGVNLASYMFADETTEKSDTPVALILVGDAAAQEKLHGEIIDDLAKIYRKAAHPSGGHEGRA